MKIWKVANLFNVPISTKQQYIWLTSGILELPYSIL